jgi:serine/threonine-protein kinase
MDKTVDHTTSEPAPDNPAPQEPDLTGRILGDFQIRRRLGQGGMGHVYLADQISLKRKVALKLLKPELAGNATSLARFKKEAEAVAQANHPNIVQIYFIGVADGISYMALEYVEGRTLRDLIEKRRSLDLRLGLHIMRQVTEALKRASVKGIIHRDIKPENILLTDQEEVKVADFGLSRLGEADAPTLRLTQSGDTLGTPLYMSPEQVEGRPIDHRTDIYSFGVTCYHMMAGEPPYSGATPYEVAFKHVREEPRPLATLRPELPPGVCVVIHKMMAKAPADRFQTAGELLEEIHRLIQGEAPLTRLRPRRSRRLLWLFAATVLLAAAGGAAFAWQRRHSTNVSPAPGGTSPSGPIDPDVERILPAQKREQVLKERVEEYLNPEKAAKNPAAGFGNCLDLALFYLDSDRLEDAEKLFIRLDDFGPQVPEYHELGHVGRAITLALRNKPEESNKLFTEFANMAKFKNNVLAAWQDDTRLSVRKNDPFKMWKDPALRYWVVQALRYNERNGLPDTAVLPALKKLRDKQMTPP